MDDKVEVALAMLRGEDAYIADARKFARIGNSIVGSLMYLFHQIPRQYAERAVLAALRILDEE